MVTCRCPRVTSPPYAWCLLIVVGCGPQADTGTARVDDLTTGMTPAGDALARVLFVFAKQVG